MSTASCNSAGGSASGIVTVGAPFSASSTAGKPSGAACALALSARERGLGRDRHDVGDEDERLLGLAAELRGARLAERVDGRDDAHDARSPRCEHTSDLDRPASSWDSLSTRNWTVVALARSRRLDLARRWRR